MWNITVTVYVLIFLYCSQGCAMHYKILYDNGKFWNFVMGMVFWNYDIL